jgi:hypothetical protein
MVDTSDDDTDAAAVAPAAPSPPQPRPLPPSQGAGSWQNGGRFGSSSSSSSSSRASSSSPEQFLAACTPFAGRIAVSLPSPHISDDDASYSPLPEENSKAFLKADAVLIYDSTGSANDDQEQQQQQQQQTPAGGRNQPRPETISTPAPGSMVALLGRLTRSGPTLYTRPAPAVDSSGRPRKMVSGGWADRLRRALKAAASDRLVRVPPFSSSLHKKYLPAAGPKEFLDPRVPAAGLRE